MTSFSLRLVLTLGIFALPFTNGVAAYAQDAPRMSGTQPEADKKKDDYEDTYKQLNLFGDVFERVRAQYVEEVEDKELIETAINGMLISLDPHSSYLNDKGYEEMRVQTRGEFGGLGIEVTMENGFVKVVSPIDDTPAFHAGIEAGDFITFIDEEAVLGLTLGEAVEKMRGRVGTDIDLIVRREGVEESLDFKITRATIQLKSVKYEVKGNVGYTRVTTFSQNTGSDLKKALRTIKKEIGENLVGFVLDLRNNPGGLLDQAIEVSDLFLDKGEIVSTRGRNDDDTKRDNASSGEEANGLPIIILINGGSASASEIVAGALQDHKRAIVMGTTSFGKGSVQTVIPLPGHGAMRLTTARYYTPSGRSIQGKGIDPDIVVEQAKIESLDYRRVRESDLRGALKNGNAEDGEEKEEDKDSVKDTKEKKDSSSDEDEKDEDKPEDYQLSRALDLLNGLSLYKQTTNNQH